MVTGTSVLGVKFTGGVIIAADMLGSYGSLARFRNISRLMKVTTDSTNTTSSSSSTLAAACEGGADGLLFVSGEQQHHPGSFRRLRRLPVPEADHRADGVSWLDTENCRASLCSRLLYWRGNSLTCVGQNWWGAAGRRTQLQSQSRPLVADQSHVQPAQQDEPTVEHSRDWRLLQRREVGSALCVFRGAAANRVLLVDNWWMSGVKHFLDAAVGWIFKSQIILGYISSRDYQPSCFPTVS